VRGLRSIYAPGFQFAKAGVMLLDLVPDTFVQSEFNWDAPTSQQRDRTKLMHALDKVNERFGKRAVLLGSAGLTQGAQTWGMRQTRRTPCYTTRWEDVPVARA